MLRTCQIRCKKTVAKALEELCSFEDLQDTVDSGGMRSGPMAVVGTNVTNEIVEVVPYSSWSSCIVSGRVEIVKNI